jgi:hypothetical protein
VTKPRGTVLTKNNEAMKQRFLEWMAKPNLTFSAIAGETFTNAQVIYTHIGLVLFFILILIVGD